MDRVAKLLVASRAVRRRIWSSLPWGYRVADLFIRLAVSSAEAFGKAVYAEFLTHGVEGMPDIHGKPAAEFDTSKPNVANRLPVGYGREFGSAVFKTLLAKFRDPGLAEEVMSSFLARFLYGGSDGIRPGSSLKEAHNYVIKGAVNEAKNVLKSRGRRREQGLTRDDDDGEETIDIHDPNALQHFDRVEKKEVLTKLKKIERDLRHIHPNAPEYVELVLTEGLQDTEIIGDPRKNIPSLLEHPFNSAGQPLTPQSWNVTYKPKILKLLAEKLGDPAV